MKTVLIYSGGMDSTVLLYKLLRDGGKVFCLSFDYGQKHRKELLSARKICKYLNVPYKIVDIKSVKSLMAGSALTSDIEVPEGHYRDRNMRLTVVPNRNMIFLALAIAQAISIKFGRVAIAVHAGDHAIYPDCRPIFVDAMKEVSKIADYKSVGVYAPFLNMTKKDIARLGKKLGVPFEQTWTCYKGLKQPCGKCGACVERQEALAEK